MTATRYRIRPAEVEARPFTAATMYEVLTWIHEHGGKATEAAATGGGAALILQTSEGNKRVDLGDWILLDAKGQFHRCKPELFAAMYEPADAAEFTEARAAWMQIGTTPALQGLRAELRIDGFPPLVGQYAGAGMRRANHHEDLMLIEPMLLFRHSADEAQQDGAQP